MWTSLRHPFRKALSNIQDNQVMLILLVYFAGAVSASFVSHLRTQSPDIWAWFDGFWQNFGTEMFGAYLTFYLIEVLVGGRRAREAEARETEERKRQLIRQLGSKSNEFALSAVEEMRAHGWLVDGSLEGASLGGANLQGAELSGANLRMAFLLGANLKRARLIEANLQGAYLVQVIFSEDTTLPDGTTWKRDTDMARFTDPGHPEFWRSDKTWSPAYRGDGEGGDG